MTIREKLNAADKKHRKDFAEYATHDSASDWHREHLERLYGCWVSINRDHFGDACVQPHIVLAEPKMPTALGDHAPVSGWGSRNQIRLRPSLITGSHKMVKSGDEFAEGRMRFVEDVLLHEAVHQYCDEVLHRPECSYKGHGPVFAGECNRIGAAHRLPPVRPAKARGKLKDLPSCAQWPYNVRLADYYLGALEEPAPDSDDEHEDCVEMLTFPCPLDPAEALPVLTAHFDEPSRRGLAVKWVPAEPGEMAQWLLSNFERGWLGATLKALAAILASQPRSTPRHDRPPQQKAARVSPNGDTAQPPRRRGRPPTQKAATVSHSRDKPKGGVIKIDLSPRPKDKAQPRGEK
jgi:hypothetical protein